MKGTIKSKQEIERLFKLGRRSSCLYCSILVLDTPSKYIDGCISDKNNKSARRENKSQFSAKNYLNQDCASNNWRFAFIAGKKLGNAPFRNRCKRVMRSVVSEVAPEVINEPQHKARDIVFIAKKNIAYAKHDKVKQQVKKMLEHAISGN